MDYCSPVSLSSLFSILIDQYGIRASQCMATSPRIETLWAMARVHVGIVKSLPGQRSSLSCSYCCMGAHLWENGRLRGFCWLQTFHPDLLPARLQWGQSPAVGSHFHTEASLLLVSLCQQFQALPFFCSLCLTASARSSSTGPPPWLSRHHSGCGW